MPHALRVYAAVTHKSKEYNIEIELKRATGIYWPIPALKTNMVKQRGCWEDAEAEGARVWGRHRRRSLISG